MGRVFFFSALLMSLTVGFVLSPAGLIQTEQQIASPGTLVQSGFARSLRFSGYDWFVKSSSGRVGPGPNYFSDSTSSVWVDSDGKLHLRLTRRAGRWYSAEVICQSSLGYGIYRFYIDGRVDDLDRSVVLGLFTWSDDPAFNNREIDIEFSRWGDFDNQNVQYVVQPYTQPENIFRFNDPGGVTQSVHTFDWNPDGVSFKSMRGFSPESTDPADIIETWSFNGAVPQPGNETPRINLWLFKGRRPADGDQREVVIARFEFLAST